MNKPHYIAYIKHESGNWLEYDDEDVTLVPAKRVLEVINTIRYNLYVYTR